LDVSFYINEPATMTDILPGSWPAAEADPSGPDEDGASRPSTATTYVTFEEPDGPESQEDNTIGSEQKGIDNAGKRGIVRMPELPPEILETYGHSTGFTGLH